VERPVRRGIEFPPTRFNDVANQDREAIIKWLDDHSGREVCLRGQGTTLKVIGRTEGVDELDACSTEIYHTELITGLDDLQVAISFHPERLALHIIGRRPGGAPSLVSVPISLPYERVQLSLAEEETTRPAHASGDRAEEVEFSPYELLHPRAD
jgi:hypothetical protein